MSKQITEILIFLIAIILVFACSEKTNKIKYEIDPELGFCTGPKINQKVPDFALPDQHGNIRELKEMVGKNGAIINFYRSASW